MALNRTLAALSFLAAAIVLVMVAAILATGFFSQEFFELGPSPALVADQLRDQPIVVYSAFFVLLAVRLRPLLSPVIIAVALAALLLTALLDAVENHHICSCCTIFSTARRSRPKSCNGRW